jgi:hypothetical protein
MFFIHVGCNMKIFNSFSEMLAEETEERQLAALHIVLRDLAHYYEKTFVEEPYMLEDDEAQQLGDTINELHFEREELIGLLLRFAVDLMEDAYEDNTIQ